MDIENIMVDVVYIIVIRRVIGRTGHRDYCSVNALVIMR